MKKRIVRSQRSARYQRLSRAARNNEDDSSSMRSLPSTKRRPRQPRKYSALDQQSVQSVQTEPAPRPKATNIASQRLDLSNRAGNGSLNEYTPSRAVAQIPSPKFRLANTTMAKPTGNESQSAIQRMEKLEHENDELRKRLEQMEKLMRQSLAMNGGSAAPATSNERSQLGRKNPHSAEGANGELETKQQDHNGQVQKTTVTAGSREHNNLAVAQRAARAEQQQIQCNPDHLGRNSGRTDESGTPKAAATNHPATTNNRSKNADPVPMLSKSTPAPPMDHARGPAERVARKQANSRKPAGEPPKANSVRRPRQPRTWRASKEPTYTQVPLDAGYATPIPKAGTATSMDDQIPTARSVTEDEIRHHQQRDKPAAKAKKRKKRRKINFYAVATGTGVGIYKCWNDMKHLLVGRNERLLHEGFETMEEAQKYVREHRNHHVGAKQKGQWEKARAERQRERRRKEEAERVMARARAAQAPNRPTPRRRQQQANTNNVRVEPDSDPREVRSKNRIPLGYSFYVIADKRWRGIYTDWNEVNWYKPRKFKAFQSREEAQSWLEANPAEAEYQEVPKGYPFYAVPGWGIYDDWRKVQRLKPKKFKCFQRLKQAQAWMDLELQEWKRKQFPDRFQKPREGDRAQQPETIDLTACDTADAVTLEDIREQQRTLVQERVEARVRRSEPHERRQSKLTSFFSKSEVENRMQKDKNELAQAVRTLARDEAEDQRMHKNIATANEHEPEYSRLVSAEMMEDERRRRTSEDGVSSSLPSIKWTSESANGMTPKSSCSNNAEAWPEQPKESAKAELPVPKEHSLQLPERNESTEPSRSTTPKPRKAKAKHKVIAVTDSSEEEPHVPKAEAKAGANNSKSAKQEQQKDKKSVQSASTADAADKPAKETGLSSEIATWGQMILDGKSGKIPTMWKLKLLRDLQRFRVAWEKYEKEVKTYNMTHSLQIKPHPVISYVDPDLWTSISQEILRPEDCTQDGEEPNHEMVKCYVLGVAPYEMAGKHAAKNIRATISAIAFKKGPTGSTNMDRWIDYLRRMRAVLKKVPQGQKQSKEYRSMYAEELRRAVQPTRLKKMVDASVYEGLDPGTNEYNAELLGARKDPTKTMNAIRSSAKALDSLIRKGILKDEWDSLAKEICKSYARGKCRLGDNCPRIHKSAGAEGGKARDNQSKTKKICWQFQEGTCTRGDKCRFRHEKSSEHKAGAGASATKSNPLNRCRQDLNNKKCKFGEKCWHAHRAAVNKRKDADPDFAEKLAKVKLQCACCGAKGHEVKDCNKLKAHLQDIKEAVGYTGDLSWFENKGNMKRCQDLFKQNRQWRMGVATAKDIQKAAKAGNVLEVQPFKIEENWIDGGWCEIGDGKYKRHVRLLLDLGAARSIGSKNLYMNIAKDIREGNLGAARIATEIRNQYGDGYNGKVEKMTNWVQLPLRADSVANTPTIVPATYISFCRECEEEVIIAGKDLCAALGFMHPAQQKKMAATTGVSDNWLGPTDEKRAYVLSKQTKEKIAANKIRTENACKVRPQGTAYVGGRAMANTKLTQWVKEPLLKCSYITTACMASASAGATRITGADLHSDFALGRFEDLAAWLRSEDEFSTTDTVKQVIKVDITRVLREMYPLRRIKNARFKVVQSANMRVVLGQDILQELERQDDDAPEPMQSDIGYDEQEEVKNYLEASLDRGVLAGGGFQQNMCKNTGTS